MFDDVVIRTADLDEALRFYRAVLPILGAREVSLEGDRGARFADLAVRPAAPGHPPTTRLHVGLVAQSEDAVQAFWQAGVDAGFRSDGEPGPRPGYAPDYVGGFLLDPGGNSIEACLHGNARADGGLIDHLWIRVQHVGLTARFYDATSAQSVFRRAAGDATSARFRGPRGGSFTVIEAPEPTTGLAMTIGAARFVDTDGRSLKLQRVDPVA